MDTAQSPEHATAKHASLNRPACYALQVTPMGPQPMTPTEAGGTQVTILRGAAAGVINVPIETAAPSDTIKAVWAPEVMDATDNAGGTTR